MLPRSMAVQQACFNRVMVPDKDAPVLRAEVLSLVEKQATEVPAEDVKGTVRRTERELWV